jgi:PPK2 family polyphosphate:nucleotide phosphotransferase
MILGDRGRIRPPPCILRAVGPGRSSGSATSTEEGGMARSVPTRKLADALRVRPGSKVDLERFDAGQTLGHDKESALATEAELEASLTSLQERLWAEARQPVLIVLQGIDASGKDGTIRKVMDAFNPLGCIVTSFKAPTPVELGHDYLWRVHPNVPAKGSISIFNRSHYEDVLVVRVHDLVHESVWRKRYRQINDWERMLTEEGTTILKFFLYIDKDEQKARLQARLSDPTRNWKFSTGDLPERALWDRYIEAFEECLERTSTAAAPWYLVPANRKWFRNLAVSRIVEETFERLDPQYPPPAPGIDKVVVE